MSTRRRHRRRSRSGLLSLILAVAALASSCSAGGGQTEAAPAQPFDLLDGSGQASFEDYRGEPIVVNFFQSTCAPCVAEMPAFEEVHQASGGEVAFVGMNTQDPIEEGRRLVEQTGITYPSGRDATGQFWKDFGGIAMPLTAFVDVDGDIVHSHNGPLDQDSLTAMIEEHLG